MADKKHADDYPDFNEVLKEVQAGQTKKMEDSLIAMILAGAKDATGATVISKDMSTGWGGELNPDTLIGQEMVVKIDPDKFVTMDSMEELKEKIDQMDPTSKEAASKKANEVFLNLLKKSKKPKLLEVPADPNHDMIWTTSDKRKLLVSQMETRHLFFALRKLYNSVVHKDFRIDCDETNVIVRVADGDTKHAMKVLFYQIGKRDDLTDEQLEKLSYMARIVRTKL